MMFRRNPNRHDGRATARVPVITPMSQDEHCAGEIVRIAREDGSIDTVRVISVWTAASSCIPMLTVEHHPHGLSTFSVRADSVILDDAPGGAG